MLTLQFWWQWAVTGGACLVAAVVAVNEALLRRVRPSQAAPWWRTCAVVMCLCASAVVVLDTTSHLARKSGLPTYNQAAAWLLLALSPLVVYASGSSWLSRLGFIIGGVGIAFTLLSVSYEVVFYAAYGSVLLVWEPVERAITTPVPSAAPGTRRFRLDYVRHALKLIVLLLVSFFGTGNIASISSFEISST